MPIYQETRDKRKCTIVEKAIPAEVAGAAEPLADVARRAHVICRSRLPRRQ
jgi:hypothetical protein